MAREKTVIVEGVHENGDRATAKPQRPNSTLFEVVSGPHHGKRGADADLFDLVGPLEWERRKVSIYETGELVTWAEFQGREFMHYLGSDGKEHAEY